MRHNLFHDSLAASLRIRQRRIDLTILAAWLLCLGYVALFWYSVFLIVRG